MPTPIVVELLPSRLHAAVFAHEVTVRGVTLPCRTCMSHGMRARQRPELVVTRVAPPGASIDAGDAEVFTLFTRLFDAPADGPALTVGLVSAFDVPFLGADAPNGVTFVEAEAFPGVSVDDDALAAVVLHAAEVPVALKYGAARVLARLGRQAGYHPFPRWWDPSRASVAHPDDEQGSTLAGVVRVALPEGTLASIDRTVVVRLPAETRAGLSQVLDGLAPDAACALLVPPEAVTDASLVWSPGQDAIAATSVSGRSERVGGNFVLFSPGQPRDNGILHEDGFAMLLRADTWRTLRSALRHGRGVTLASGDAANYGLRIEWTRAADAPAAADEGAVAQLARVVFLQPEELVAREVSSRELSRYVAALRRTVGAHLTDAPRGDACDLLLQVDLDARRRPALSLGVRPLPAPPSLAGLVTKLESLAAPGVRGAVGLKLLFTVHGGSGETLA
ncbi:MAG: hypothetical protein JWM10_2856 [Myxococcaceae bacterium]|nr:hypothetical protein [Myxococcaceae bacterium]